MTLQYQQHLEEKNRVDYNTKATEAGRFYESVKHVFSPFNPPPSCSVDGFAHYSWDYAQQLHYPINPQQPGPIYFKTPVQVRIF